MGKANSIQGNKMNDVDVVYTMWENLHKTNGMDVGQIGFHKQKAVRKIRLASRENVIVNRLNKTKVEKQLDFRAEREGRDKKERQEEEAAQLRSYSNLMTEENMRSNKDAGSDSD